VRTGGGSSIVARARSSHLEFLDRAHRTSPQQRFPDTSDPTLAMYAPCRIAVGAARALESNAAPRVARRTFTSCGSHSTTPSRTTAGAHTQRLRQAQRSANSLGSSAGGVQAQRRSFSQTTSRHKLKTIDQIRTRNKGGVCFPITPDHCWLERYWDANRANKRRSHSTSQPPSFSS